MSPFDEIAAREILPQREPFVFVDRLVHYDERETVTVFTVPAEHLLVADGYLTAPGVLENMAQSSAARIGYLCKFTPAAGGGGDPDYHDHFPGRCLRNHPDRRRGACRIGNHCRGVAEDGAR